MHLLKHHLPVETTLCLADLRLEKNIMIVAALPSTGYSFREVRQSEELIFPFLFRRTLAERIRREERFIHPTVVAMPFPFHASNLLLLVIFKVLSDCVMQPF